MLAGAPASACAGGTVPKLLEALKRLVDDPRTAEEAIAVIAKAEGRE